jgi:hypothetical protein
MRKIIKVVRKKDEPLNLVRKRFCLKITNNKKIIDISWYYSKIFAELIFLANLRLIINFHKYTFVTAIRKKNFSLIVRIKLLGNTKIMKR